eukprot:COSAG01_NODE_1527_length_10015_cov_79.013312_5_plen_127_part_00
MGLVAQIVAQDPLDRLMPSWQGGTEDEPVVFDEWNGAFHDGSGPLGTYQVNQDSWALIDPCKEETAAGKSTLPARVLALPFLIVRVCWQADRAGCTFGSTFSRQNLSTMNCATLASRPRPPNMSAL